MTKEKFTMSCENSMFFTVLTGDLGGFKFLGNFYNVEILKVFCPSTLHIHPLDCGTLYPLGPHCCQ